MRQVALILLVVALSVPAAALPDCRGECRSGQDQFSFAIPLGAVVEAIGLAAKLAGVGFVLPPGAGLLIPGITVNLHTEFFGDAWVACDEACCPDGCLYMGAELLLSGTARFDFNGLLPSSSQFTSVIPVVWRRVDRYDPDHPCGDPCDTDLNRCEIGTTWSYTQKNFQVALFFPVVGDVMLVPVSNSRGVGLSTCRVYWGCDDYETRPVLVSWPEEVVVPIGGEARFKVAGTMYTTSRPVFALRGAPPYDRPLRYALSPSRWSKVGVSLAITSDLEEDGKIIPGGHGTITVDKDAPIPDGATETIFITVKDPSTGEMDKGAMTVRYVRNHPPQAISDGMTISPDDNCAGLVKYAATDPDLPDNHGYQLYFVPLGTPLWDCSSAIDMYWDPFIKGMSGEYNKEERVYSRLFECVYSDPAFISLCSDLCPIPEGSYKFPFAVVEYNPSARQYGFADQGVWTLTVRNAPPETSVSPREIRAQPGETVEASVTATNPDSWDWTWIILDQTSGPGTLVITGAGVDAEGRGWKTGPWTWTVPQNFATPWQLVGFQATDGCGGTSLAYHAGLPPRERRGYIIG